MGLRERKENPLKPPLCINMLWASFSKTKQKPQHVVQILASLWGICKMQYDKKSSVLTDLHSIMRFRNGLFKFSFCD